MARSMSRGHGHPRIRPLRESGMISNVGFCQAQVDLKTPVNSCEVYKPQIGTPELGSVFGQPTQPQPFFDLRYGSRKRKGKVTI